MNLLLAGSGYRLLDSSNANKQVEIAFDMNSFREFAVGDYHLLHTDSLDMRALTINFWLATPGWKTEWGGNLLWCGLPRYGNDKGTVPFFPDAIRIPPKFNQAMLFLPHYESIHAVELVTPQKDADWHRFALTAWMKIAGFDEELHWRAFNARLRDTLAYKRSARGADEL